MARALYYFIKNNGKADAIQFLETVISMRFLQETGYLLFFFYRSWSLLVLMDWIEQRLK